MSITRSRFNHQLFQFISGVDGNISRRNKVQPFQLPDDSKVKDVSREERYRYSGTLLMLQSVLVLIVLWYLSTSKTRFSNSIIGCDIEKKDYLLVHVCIQKTMYPHFHLCMLLSDEVDSLHAQILWLVWRITMKFISWWMIRFD